MTTFRIVDYKTAQRPAGFAHGTEVKFCDADRAEVRAQVVYDHGDDTADLSLYDAGGHIVAGIVGAPRATTPEDRIKPGFWY